MDSNFDVNAARQKLAFLYRRTAMSKTALNAWMECDLFVERVWYVVLKGDRIDDSVLLKITKETYDEIVEDRGAFQNFKIQSARRGIHQLERSCGVAQ